MKEIKYKYALNEQGDIVSIYDVTSENKSTHQYNCISCGSILTPRIGTKNAPHFAHRNNTPNCSSETYLHKLAKQKIKEKFEQSKTFTITYYSNDKCINHNGCPIYVDNRCIARNKHEYNLKEYYNLCREEVGHDRYIADLLLTHTEKPDRDAIFIEIHVHHKSTELKKNSGHRIIELTIKSESDIEYFINNTIEESTFPDEKKAGFAEFYGFKSGISKDCFQCNVPKFFLFESGKIYAEYIKCSEAFKKKAKNFEICFLTNHIELSHINKYGCILALMNDAHQKFCQLCKYYSSEYPYICKCYKRLATPKHPNAWDANKCQYYREANDEVRRIKSTIKEYDSNSGVIDGIMYKILK